MRRTYVLDTSSLIHDPTVFKQYHNSDIFIPIVVLNELDKLKKFPSEAGKNARVVIRMLDQIADQGDISKGIVLDNDIKIQVDATYYDLSLELFQGLGDPTYGDTQILACAISFATLDDVCLISNDINLRIKAKARGIKAEACKGDKQSLNDLFSGLKVLTNEDAGAELAEKNRLDPRIFDVELEPNECVQFNNQAGEMLSAGRKVSSGKVKPIRKIYPWGLVPRNQEQAMLIDLIMDKNIDLITTTGISGCGKSIVVIACALELVLNKREFDKLIIYRPIQAVGNDIGYTPGTVEEKLAPWFQAVMDSFEYLFSNKSANKVGGDWRRDLEMFQKKGRIEFSPIVYIRGRSIANAVMIVDEGQNLSAQDMKTILTRAGEGTKIILTGDVDQIDNQFLDATNNGLVSVIERFRSSELAGHITLTKGERSRLATASAKIL